ncbi:uncharacterized protein YbaR (Trm112 family) [Pseudorhodobacter sp. 4114]|nr:uncharacterized protein YbaR (Trm112 family) [Pseudorhodobacter sp. 4114]
MTESVAPEPGPAEATARDTPSGTTQAFDPRMLESLVCPVSNAILTYDAAAQELISKAAHLAFPIRNGIPVMLVSEARALE